MSCVHAFYDNVDIGSGNVAVIVLYPKSVHVFVISAGGSGVPVYRALRKENRAFTAGILYPNDIDYELARLLADEIILEEVFEPIGDAAIAKAKAVIDRCSEVIVCDVPIGTMNQRVTEVIEYAAAQGKISGK